MNFDKETKSGFFVGVRGSFFLVAFSFSVLILIILLFAIYLLIYFLINFILISLFFFFL